VETLTLTMLSSINQSYYKDMGTKMPNNNTENDDIPKRHHHYYCYWLCNRKAELKVYTDFGNILHLCKMCYEIYDPAYRLKTEEIRD
jgi:hypothetical protein